MGNKARILFVDDEKRVLNSMRGMFRREFELFLASDGAAAVKIARENRIDVIVADQRMPGMSGIEVLEKVKEISPNTIRILLTGYADPAAVQGSINVGEVFRFLGKPCSPTVLRETLALAIDAARPVRSARPAADTPARPQPAADTGHAVHVRDVADSGDSELPVLSAETQRPLPAQLQQYQTPVKTLAKEIGVVLYTVDAQFAETAIRAVSTERSTTLATSLIKVMQAIEQERTGVLVTDVTTSDIRLQNMIGALKHYVPELVTIVVSDKRDSSDMISLINYGQIYRFLNKPVTSTQLRSDIGAAAIKHLDLRSNPYNIRRHTVAKPSIEEETSPTPIQTLTRLRELRSRRAAGYGGYY